jgi:hypothetical protein
MWKCPALRFAFMLFLGTPVLALNANGLRNKLVEIPQTSPAAASRYIVDGLVLGGRVKSGNQQYQRYNAVLATSFPVSFLAMRNTIAVPNRRHSSPS